MTRSALVTGSEARVAEASDALEKVGFTAIRASGAEAFAEAIGKIAPGSLSCYVQLPRQTEVTGASLVDRVRQFLAEGLLARFDVASSVLPLLANDAFVVLVAGNVPGDATPDDRHARIDLLRVLARAILAECGQGGVGAVVVGYDRSAEEIAALALKRGEAGGWRKSAEAAAELGSDLSYADWRRETLHLTTEDER